LAQIAAGDLRGQPTHGIDLAAQGTALGRSIIAFERRLDQSWRIALKRRCNMSGEAGFTT